MPLEKRLIPVQFGGGIHTKVDPKQLQAGKLLTLQNGQFSQEGLLNKRFGYDILNTTIEGGGNITNGVALATLKSELILFNGLNLFSYIPATGNWSNRGTAISINTLDKDVLRRSDAQQLNPDMGYLNDIEVYAWEDSRGGVYYSALDTTTGAFVVSGLPLNAQAQQPKVISFQEKIYVFYSDGVSSLYYKTISPANPTLLSPATKIVSDGYPGINGFPYDVSVIGSTIQFAYFGTIANPSFVSVNYFYLDTNLIKQGAGQIFAATAPTTHGAINIIGDSQQNVWVAYANGIGVYSAFGGPNTAPSSVLTVDTADVRAITMVEDWNSNPLAIFSESEVLIIYEVHASSSVNEQLRLTTITGAGTVSSPIQTIRSVGLSSKAWKYNGNIYFNAAYDSPLQSTDFTFYVPPGAKLINSQLPATPVIVAKETPEVGGGLQSNGMVAETVATTSGIYKFANLQAGKLISEANTLFSLLGVNSTQLTFNASTSFTTAVQDNILLISGGILQGYDGVATTELGFHLYPENIVATPAGSDGFLSTGTYQYQVTYEWTDNAGQIHRSAPSVPVTAQVTALNHVALSGPTLRLTQKSRVSIVIYRTGANGTTFNRVTSTISPLINDPTTDTWSFTDTLSDISASSNELIYTTGNILSNIAPPANSILTTYNNRAFLAGLSDKLLIWYSQTVVDNSNANTIPPQFCAELTISCDPRGGDITALGLLNQALIIFKEREIFALQGNGPDATGNNNDFQDPQLITSDVGCINANSVAVVPMGLLFQSHKGIYLLDQSLNVSYVGAEVEAFNSLTVTATTPSPQDNQIIFTTASGTSLVYDYYYKQWSTWTNQYAADASVYNNLFAFVTTNGQVWVQNRSKFTDGMAPILLSWTLPNLAFAGLQGFQRVFKVFILGAYKGAHTLNVQVAYDYSDAYAQSATITPSAGSSWGSDFNWGASQLWGGSYQIYEFRLDLNIQKCTAIRLFVSDNQSSSYNEGYSISSVVFEVGALPGGNRLPQSNQYGVR